jgi:hypothetical protein
MAAINHPLGRSHRRAAATAGRLRPALGHTNWWLLSAFVILGVSAMLPVVQNSTATTRGFEIKVLQAEQARLQGDIRVLESDVATLTSLERVQRRAAEIGLFPAQRPIYLTVAEAGPAPAKIPAEYLPGPAPQTGGAESWWRSLLRLLPLIRD